MILDTSAIVAVLLKEPGFERLELQSAEAPEVGVGTPTLLEASMVLTTRLRSDPTPELERFLREVGAVAIPFSDEHWRQAHRAFMRYGKGRHPAALNFGDCCSYAVARLAGRPLLCVGEDFPKTDLPLA